MLTTFESLQDVSDVISYHLERLKDAVVSLDTFKSSSEFIDTVFFQVEYSIEVSSHITVTNIVKSDDSKRVLATQELIIRKVDEGYTLGAQSPRKTNEDTGLSTFITHRFNNPTTLYKLINLYYMQILVEAQLRGYSL